MKAYEQENDKPKNIINEDQPAYASLEEMELARLKEAISLSDMEKFRRFCRMMRLGKMLASAKITHQP